MDDRRQEISEYVEIKHTFLNNSWDKGETKESRRCFEIKTIITYSLMGCRQIWAEGNVVLSTQTERQIKPGPSASTSENAKRPNKQRNEIIRVDGTAE